MRFQAGALAGGVKGETGGAVEIKFPESNGSGGIGLGFPTINKAPASSMKKAISATPKYLIRLRMSGFPWPSGHPPLYFQVRDYSALRESTFTALDDFQNRLPATWFLKRLHQTTF